MPTFREKATNDLSKILDFSRINELMIKTKSIFLIKQHSNIKQTQNLYTKSQSNIIFLPSFIDVYPLLPFTDILITDYSSIFFDYMLLNKPIVFFSYDQDFYLQSERGFYFNYEDLARSIGYVAKDFDSLNNELLKLLSGENISINNQESILNFWNTYRGEASLNLLKFIMKVLS